MALHPIFTSLDQIHENSYHKFNASAKNSTFLSTSNLASFKRSLRDYVQLILELPRGLEIKVSVNGGHVDLIFVISTHNTYHLIGILRTIIFIKYFQVPGKAL